MNTITVSLAERSYPIYVGAGTLHSFPEIATSHKLPTRIAVVTDTHVAALYLEKVVRALRHYGFQVTPIVMPPGERQKSLSRANAIFDKLLAARFTRDSALVALGGGVVGDVAGFVAAVYRRGISLVQVPTTLLGQMESAIGGKTGINLPAGKNAIGVFWQPRFVFSDIELLATLPRREIFCGIGEILKYAMLREETLQSLETNIDGLFDKNLDVLQEIVLQCNRYKAALIGEDEQERNPGGGRMVLNLGHTIGHALEVLSNYSLHHGEAVLIGLRWELVLAHESNIIDRRTFERLNALFEQIPLKPKLQFLKKSAIVHSLLDKIENARFILPERIGSVVVRGGLDKSLIRSVVKRMVKGV